MAKAEFVLLAHDYNPKKIILPGWFLSEKLDGIRCLWDGGVSTGVDCAKIPWANTTKDARFRIEPVATGLWTRYGKVIYAPEWFLNQLPKMPLDGELTVGRGKWQETSSIVKCMDPEGRDWTRVKYMVFDAPSFDQIFAPRTINTTNFKKTLSPECMDFVRSKIGVCIPPGPFYEVHAKMLRLFRESPNFMIHRQIQLKGSVQGSLEEMNRFLSDVELQGGEGVMLRNGISYWKPERSWDLVKVKRTKDAEAEVIGYTWAKPTDLEKSISGKVTDKLLGMMGSLRLRTQITGTFGPKEFDLSGFTDDERKMQFTGIPSSVDSEEVREKGVELCGQVVDDRFENPKFPRGSMVTYKYRELSQDGKPKEARFMRKFES